MAEIEITLPTVQYGNVKIRATPEEWGTLLDSPHSIGMMTATYVNLFTQGFKVGSQMDVSAPVGASQEASEESFQGAVETAQREAQRLLSKGLGGVTEVPEDGNHPDAEDYKNNSDTPPWNQPQVDTPRKPWETGGTTPAIKPVVDEGW